MTLIITNAVAALLAVWAVVHLLGHGIHTHRRDELGRDADITSFPVRERERRAA